MRRVSTLIQLALISVCVFPRVSDASEAMCFYNFETAPPPPNCSFAALSSAVVQLFSKSTQAAMGTAYFISDDTKFLITADHVLEHWGRPKQLDAQNSALNQGEKFTVEVVDTMGPMGQDDYDVALLRVVDTTFQGQVTPIDISFGVPKSDDHLCVIGYPITQPGENTAEGAFSKILRPPNDVILEALHKEKVKHIIFEVNHLISEGYSGGPLLTTGGLAIGTVRFGNDNQAKAYYEPLSLDSKLLAQLKHLKLPNTLLNANDMLSKRFPEEKLAAALTVGPIRNVSLTAWYFQLMESPEVKSRNVPEDMKSLITCPIIKMLRDRRLDEWAEGLEAEVRPMSSITDPYNNR
jgi:S1-C subfamily serine protease